jgi:hypothetical protein
MKSLIARVFDTTTVDFVHRIGVFSLIFSSSRLYIFYVVFLVIKQNLSSATIRITPLSNTSTISFVRIVIRHLPNLTRD